MLLAPLLLLAASAAGFTIPDGQPDGVYSVHIDANGTEIHTLLSLPDEINNASLPRSIVVNAKDVRKRQQADDFDVVCAGYDLGPGDTDTANALLDMQCGSGSIVKWGEDFYAISGCTVAYFCNFSDTFIIAVCSAYERGQADLAITNACGLYRAGWTDGDEDILADINYSYGYENFCGSGSSFCSRGTSVP